MTTTNGTALAARQTTYSPAITGLAQTLGLNEQSLVDVVKKAVFKGDASREDVLAAVMICNEFGLNPILKQIHAIPNKGSMLIIVGVDGWAKIINSNHQFDGIEFEFLERPDGTIISCTCHIWRKDRSRPTVVTEYMDECYRKTEPWDNWPRRMLRHKAMIQCARLAFSLTGIIDPDEAGRIRPEVVLDVTTAQPIDVQEMPAKPRHNPTTHRPGSLASPPTPKPQPQPDPQPQPEPTKARKRTRAVEPEPEPVKEAEGLAEEFEYVDEDGNPIPREKWDEYGIEE